jgi:hypothetical protein
MKRAFFYFVALIFFAFVPTAHSATVSSSMLDEVNSKIEKTPNDPQLYDAKAVLLMELGRYNEGYDAAEQAKAMHIKANDNVVWLALERIELNNFVVTVGFNMTATERNPPETGITRPLTFHLFMKDAVPIVGIFDYEVGIIDGKAASAAFRERDGKTFLNFDTAAKVSSYEIIRLIAKELIKAVIPHRQLPGGPGMDIEI